MTPTAMRSTRVDPRRYLVKTCARDIEWLSYLLRSLAKFDPETEVVVISDDEQSAEEILFLPDGPRENIATYAIGSQWPEAERIANPYIRQQYVKMTADRIYPNGVHIQLDSDCFLHRTPVPGDFFDADDGRPIWFYEKWEFLPASAQAWREPTEHALGTPIYDEHMRRPGFAVDARILGFVRSHIESRHGPLVDYLAGVRRFSEYNVIGAWIHANGSDTYSLKDTPVFGGPWGIPDSPCIEQGWSVHAMNADRKARYEEILSR